MRVAESDKFLDEGRVALHVEAPEQAYLGRRDTRGLKPTGQIGYTVGGAGNGNAVLVVVNRDVCLCRYQKLPLFLCGGTYIR